MPYTVVSGFMTGIGIILIILQIGPFLGQPPPTGGVIGTYLPSRPCFRTYRRLNMSAPHVFNHRLDSIKLSAVLTATITRNDLWFGGRLPVSFRRSPCHWYDPGRAT